MYYEHNEVNLYIKCVAYVNADCQYRRYGREASGAC